MTAEGVKGKNDAAALSSSDAAATQDKKRKRKKKISLPPQQLLCDALAHVFKCPVEIVALSSNNHGDAPPKQWASNCTTRTVSSETIALQLLDINIANENNNDRENNDNYSAEWKALADFLPMALPEILSCSKNNKVLPEGDVRNAVMLHARAQGIAKNGFKLVATETDEGFLELRNCMNCVCRFVTKAIWEWIRPGLLEKDQGEVMDLFTDDYNSGQLGHHEPLDLLVDLLEEPVSVVSPAILDSLLGDQDKPIEDQNQRLGELFLRYVLARISSTMASQSFTGALLTRRVCGLSNLLSLYRGNSGVCIGHTIQGELNRMSDKTGSDIQSMLSMAPLFMAAAYVVPVAGTEFQPVNNSAATIPGSFLRQLMEIDDFPMCIFRANKRGGAVDKAMEEARNAMKSSRIAAISMLKMAFQNTDKETVFHWLGNIAKSNLGLVELLKADVLRADGTVASSSTRAFLLGLVSALVDFCTDNLQKRLKKLGADAFDPSYLGNKAPLGLESVAERNRLFQGSVESKAGEKLDSSAGTFSGATHLFFLSCLFIRVSIHPCLRMHSEFLQSRTYSHLVGVFNDASKGAEPVAERYMGPAKSVFAAFLGWRSFFEDRDVTSSLTEFALLQLDWVVAVAEKNSVANLAAVPDWMCRDPALWLSHLAQTAPFLLKPAQAERAVENATLLLDLGSSAAMRLGGTPYTFSPVVLSALIDIVSAFVQAGVHRARGQQQRRQNMKGWPRGQDKPAGSSGEVDDNRSLDVYSSFARDDLGVTVFTNRLVREKLCPTLLQTFRDVDMVEGVDADRDGNFSKFTAKSKIAELLLRLWNHPDGKCRESIAALPAVEIAPFVCSVVSVCTVNFDFAIASFENFRMGSKPGEGNNAGRLGRHGLDAYLQGALSSAVGNFLGARRMLALLCALSSDDRVAGCIGGYLDKKLTADVSNLILQLILKLTSTEGGMSPSLDEAGSESTADLLARYEKMSQLERVEASSDVMRRRVIMKEEYGLDISVLCHLLLALGAKWHLTAAKEAEKNKSAVSPFLSCLIDNEDCDAPHLENVFRRLVAVPWEETSPAAIFEHDGYVDHIKWKHKFVEVSVPAEQKRNQHTARQDQMKHEEISQLASNDDIALFLGDLRSALISREPILDNGKADSADVPKMEAAILASDAPAAEMDAYGEALREWLVSSEPFLKQEGSGSFGHKYDAAARKQASHGSGKTLTREARKCHKGLPEPSANASIFVCFAEERMDIARAVVTGPAGTPYAHGVFSFDVYFPPSYPAVPPMVTFMTTGNGSERISPNLYVDGKVCISLLGTTNAGDESERWNISLSSLAQVMISIQAQVLGNSQPYFNEGNGVPEAMKATKAGKEGSFQYNNRVRLATLRYAMIGQIRHPPTGFQEVLLRHFSICRRRIVVQARLWLLESRGTRLEKRFERCYAELLSLLSEERMQAYDSVDPLDEDMSALEKLDSSFVRQFRTKAVDNNGVEDRKMSARTPVFRRVPTFNPWAMDDDLARDMLADGRFQTVVDHSAFLDNDSNVDFYS